MLESTFQNPEKLATASVDLRALLVELGHSVKIKYYKAHAKRLKFLQGK